MMKRLSRAVVPTLIIALTCLMLSETIASVPLNQTLQQRYKMEETEQRVISSMNVTQRTAANPAMNDGVEAGATSWIVKWKQGKKDAKLLQHSEILNEQAAVDIAVLKPVDEAETEHWLRDAKQSPQVEYIEPNHAVHSLASGVKPNDKLYAQQHYLRQIGADTAWTQAKSNSSITIALVDTGIDFNHPDLKQNIVKGINLLDSGLPQDDNGHGTSVAGVVGAVGNNNKGTAGLLWSAKIMPIKALDSRGYGDEDKLGAGILYAVDHGAKIVVMSVGLYRYSKYMQDIVNYAEEKGVLLIAATGNDGGRYQEKVAVKYPAAYPTVFAVGGSSPQMKVEPRTNIGPEIDVVAPWHVFTTALGGGYKSEEGTSMAAPQAAGVAALLWSKYPELKPYQVRHHLRYTAKDIDGKGWDRKSGYGLLRADAALTVPFQEDAFGTNTARNKARVFPIDTSLSAVLHAKEEHWYVIDAPYDGTLKLQFQRIKGAGQVHVMHFIGETASGTKFNDISGKQPSIPVKRGKNVLRLSSDDIGGNGGLTYKLASRFIVYQDPFEPNDKQYQAYAIPARTQDIVGTFSHAGDTDWYMIQLPSKATLRLKLSTDTVRIDPALEIKGSQIDTRWIDEEKEGQSEFVQLEDLPPGKYYIQVQNAVTARPEPVAGEYKLHVEYMTQLADPNEPNDKMYEAVTISEGTEYKGVFHDEDDVDWFQFIVKQPVYATFKLSQLPSNRIVTMAVMSKEQKPLGSGRNASGETEVTTGTKLDPGTYYIRLTTNAKFDTRYYRLSVSTEPLIAGLRDVKGHWAENSIVQAVESGWMNGYGDAKFEPHRHISRAEAASVISNAFKLSRDIGKAPAFTDVPSSHWAHAAVARVAKAGIAAGVEPKRFGPNRMVKRAEMAVMLGKALGLAPAKVTEAPFQDVAATHWAAPMIAEMKRQGLISGNEGEGFGPERFATRAEFVAMLVNVLNSEK
ncbi:S8 family serine peptidase [Paenibacillus apiarius]|uniref:S8 family serine peptidase n=1 Tax=Paenibacillus apiarius TaxID=46240 RepID=A0ABT4DSK7_9BACL|nr:S8 family serine peptidase [Paenibacillus apiarius]MCY9514224.1 S8 family serine peptidase [Paenibacillus apiarius]MCY9520347.1 S8 family serine peptidase [Paenibacillus apiarius]MCY9554756.1 S8 family serine peptidase [Paenibacillus apiarius]MCY9557373.1 S8 family serine peptidase [Paenibacillus apiarius]MCY9682448.1 S8 family serine peptidase [Paenibacillus apiarius]